MASYTATPRSKSFLLMTTVSSPVNAPLITVGASKGWLTKMLSVMYERGPSMIAMGRA